ncbi:transcription factor Sfp1p [Monosporozyma unispora]|nr:hypothetical protein C6P44_001129 [Kazachstania unispora]
MDFTSTLTPNKNITNNSPSTTATTANNSSTPATTSHTPAIFISHTDMNSGITANNKKTNNSIALSVSPTSTPPSGNVDLNKLRRDSIAHSQGMGGVSWGSVTIGSWLRDEVMLRGATTNNNNNNNNTIIPNNTTPILNNDTPSNYTSNTKMYNANRNSISYRRLSTINNMNNNKSVKVDNLNNSNLSLNLSTQPSNPQFQSPPFNTSTYLPNLEKQFCKDYSCCGLSLPGLHDLLRHYEEAHIGGNTVTSTSNNNSNINNSTNPISNNANIKKPTLSKQQYTKQHKHIIQQQLKSTNIDNNSKLSTTINNSRTFNNSMVSTKPTNSTLSQQLYNNNTNTSSNTTNNSPIPKNSNKNNLNNYTFNNNKSKDMIIRNNNNNNASINPTSKKNNSLMSAGIDLDFMDDDILNIGLNNNNNTNNNTKNNNNNSSVSTKGQITSQGLRNSSIPSAIMVDPLSTSNHLNMSHGMVDIDEDEDDEDEDDDEDDEDEDDVMHDNNNNNNTTTNTSSNNDMKNQINSMDNSNLHNILMANSDINNLLRDSFSMPTMNFNNDNNHGNHGLTMNHNDNNHHNNNNSNNNNNTQTTNSQTINLNPTSNLNNNNNRPNFIDDPARRLYVMDHEEHKPFKCPVIGCEKTYKNQNGLKYHRLHGHQNQKLLENPDGTFTILDPDSNEPYPEGMGYEKDKPYRCEVCGKRYKNLNGLKYHRGHSTH